MFILKRNGNKEEFNPQKIKNAISLAFDACEVSIPTEEIDELIDKRLQDEEYAYRSEAGDKYILYENQQPKIMVKKCIDTGDWHFIAVNKDNQELPGYPIPDQETLGKMKFSADGNIATDKYGRTYRVIEYYSDDM